MKKVFTFLLVLVCLACAEKLMEKPEGLIPKEKMVLILNDLAIVNSAKLTNANILTQNNIEPTAYIFTKYGIDSLQFVESDRYYTSIPEEHEEIYKAVETKLEAEKERLSEIKRLNDSVKAAGLKGKRKPKTTKGSLSKKGDKKKQS